MKNLFKAMLFVWALPMTTTVFANPIEGDTCPDPLITLDRSATLEGAAECAYGLGNPDASDINVYWGDEFSWLMAGEIALADGASGGSDGYFSATADGGWGAIPNSGTWEIATAFWDVYDNAVITMHVGNGGGDPDHWAWLMSDGALSGDWNLEQISGNGGGLSNFKLWGTETTASVPEPTTLTLIGIGLAGLGFARRKKKLA
ncbi:MAG: PEP-CTERM sorting domain-containing protein [Candidatus Thiodiazotropha sp. (ex. Lucinoma kazani)]